MFRLCLVIFRLYTTIEKRTHNGFFIYYITDVTGEDVSSSRIKQSKNDVDSLSFIDGTRNVGNQLPTYAV